MYTAKITQKTENTNGTLALTVEFSNGVKTITETITPQDYRGYEHWRDSRLQSLNTSEILKEEDNLNKPYSLETPVKTKDELDQEAWFEKLNRLHRVRVFLIEAGIFTGQEEQVTDLKADIIDTYKPEYFVKV